MTQPTPSYPVEFVRWLDHAKYEGNRYAPDRLFQPCTLEHVGFLLGEDDLALRLAFENRLADDETATPRVNEVFVIIKSCILARRRLWTPR